MWPKVTKEYNPETGQFWYINVCNGHSQEIRLSKKEAQHLLQELEKIVKTPRIKKFNRASELLKRVFKMIADSHFGDHKMSPSYIDNFRFDRGLGEDIAGWVQAYHREYYKSKRNKYLKEEGE